MTNLDIPIWQGITLVGAYALGFLGLVTFTTSLLGRHDAPRPARRVKLGAVLPAISIALLGALALAPSVSGVSVLGAITSYLGALLLIAGGILLASKRDTHSARKLGAALLVIGCTLLVLGSMFIGKSVS